MVKITSTYDGKLNVNNWWEFAKDESAVVEDSVWNKQGNHPIVQSWVAAGVLVVHTLTKAEVEDYQRAQMDPDEAALAAELAEEERLDAEALAEKERLEAEVAGMKAREAQEEADRLTALQAKEEAEAAEAEANAQKKKGKK